MKIPFDRCVILTTLEFDRILDRLESAIYDSRFQPSPDSYDFDQPPIKQAYYGELRGFKFSATRTIGFKHFHLPSFLLPTVEGRIDRLHNGHEISLSIDIHNFTCIIMLAWFGALFTFTTASILDNVLGDINDYSYLEEVPISLCIYLSIVAYFYLAARRATKFFKTLFSQRLLGTSAIVISTKPKWQMDLQYQQATFSRTAVEWMRVNLPSLPKNPGVMGKMPERKGRGGDGGTGRR
jgi:hypothetical protein